MAENNKKTFWPHMILGFLLIGISLGYWTVQSASSIPVQESNQYMLKYQMADMHINEIMKRKAAFDQSYEIQLIDVETMVMTDNVNSNRPQPNAVKLSEGMNEFTYKELMTNKEAMNEIKKIQSELINKSRRISRVVDNNALQSIYTSIKILFNQALMYDKCYF